MTNSTEKRYGKEWTEMKKKLLIAVITVLMGFLMTACGNSSSVQNEAAMNTIQPYSLSDEDSEMVTLVAPGAASF